MAPQPTTQHNKVRNTPATAAVVCKAYGAESRCTECPQQACPNQTVINTNTQLSEQNAYCLMHSTCWLRQYCLSQQALLAPSKAECCRALRQLLLLPTP